MNGKKISVGILGATGSVGQKFALLLKNHPYFTLSEVAASERSAGRKYGEAVPRLRSELLPEGIAESIIKPADGSFESKVLFSGLDASVAGEIEASLAARGHIIISNSKNHRWDQDVPLLIPEVNPGHLDMIATQQYGGGCIVTNPNCSTIGLVIALKPLMDAFGIEKVSVSTLQAISGAGYPGIPASDILDNVIPHIGGEEEKLEREPLKILGSWNGEEVSLSALTISAQVHRVPVSDGHTEAVQISLKHRASAGEIIKAWEEFRGEPQELSLPTAPEHPIVYLTAADAPQPLLHRNIGNGMSVVIGRLRHCPLFGYKFTLLSHNTVRGAAGGAILCAELMAAKGIIA